jgi:transcriptional regulator with XRE-family HTH domain
MSSCSDLTPRDPELTSLCLALKDLVARAGIKQEKVADKSSLDAKQVSSYLRGRVNPGYVNLRRLCNGIGVTPVELMARIEAIEEGKSGQAGEPGAANDIDDDLREPVSGRVSGGV